MAIDRQGILDAVAEGVGVTNPAVPAGLKDWSIPINQKWPPTPPNARKRPGVAVALLDPGWPSGR
jgi:hypothetical protein